MATSEPTPNAPVLETTTAARRSAGAHISTPAELRTTLNAACDRFGKITKDFGIKAE